jgi:hypothetical protein
MIDAGIIEGDMVLVERGKQPKPGQIVIADVDGETTIKYFRKKGDKVWLEPANKKYKPIIPRTNSKFCHRPSRSSASTNMPLAIRSFPRAILHIDGDSFLRHAR